MPGVRYGAKDATFAKLHVTAGGPAEEVTNWDQRPLPFANQQEAQDNESRLGRKYSQGKTWGDEVPEGTPEYEALLGGVIAQQKGKAEKAHKHIIRSHPEVIQHPEAFRYLVHAKVVEKKSLTGDLIREQFLVRKTT